MQQNWQKSSSLPSTTIQQFTISDVLYFVWKAPNDGRMKTNTVFIFKYVSKMFVRNFLKSLKRKKATGLDELQPGMLKDCHQHLIDPLQPIINLSLQLGIVPSAWKKAKVVPLFKSGDKNKTENYRPISIHLLIL